MLTLARYVTERIRTSFWFLPSLLVVGAFVGAALMVGLDAHIDPPEDSVFGQLIYSGNAEGARTILGTIAGAMMTIAGVVFSLTMVTLTLASSQFGPRLIRNFMKSRGNQLVLGTFIATFIYCLLVLLTVHRNNDELFIPGLAVSVGVLIAVINSAMLVWFIHHLASIIQADLIVADVGDELDGSLDKLFPEHFGCQSINPETIAASEPIQVIEARGGSYLRAIRAETLIDLARSRHVVLEIEPRPGDMLMPGWPLVKVHGDHRLTEKEEALVHQAFLTGSQRSAEQDSEFAVRQLVEVALRALSPSTNDPFTAMTCIDRLGVALCRLACREFPGGYLADEDGQPCLVVRPLTFAGVFHAAFDQIRQVAPDHAAVSIRLIEVLVQLAGCLRDPERLELVEQTAVAVAEQCRERLAFEYDRNKVDDRLAELMSMIKRRIEAGQSG